MMVRFCAACLLLMGCIGQCHAQGTQLWKETKSEDFEKGTGRGIAIRSDGMLVLARNTTLISTTSSTYLWSAAADGHGRFYLAGGSPARVYSVGLDGKATTVFEGKELQAQSVIVGVDGSVFFATSPDGRVYRMRGNTPEVFFDPKTKYIWALAADRSNNLYVGTGDDGQIFRVDANGNGTLFFKTDEAHIRSLMMDHDGNLIAGSDGSGLVYRIDPKGQGFVLFSAPKKEITALAIDDAGNIYAASVGEKRTSGTASGKSTVPAVSGGSEVDKVSSDGSVLKVWSSKEELAYALTFDADQDLLIATGNKGKVYSIARNAPAGEFSTLLTLSASQVTGFVSAGDAGVMASTSNLGKAFLISNRPPDSGSFESDLFDAKTSAKWGRVEARGAGRFEIALRTGNVDNPEKNWSSWNKVDLSGKTAQDVPAARFAQWRAILYPGAALDSVAVNYRQKNIAPVVDEVTVTVGSKPATATTATSTTAAGPSTSNEVTVKWTAHDENGDDLRYSVFYRPAEGHRWIQLRENIKEKQLTLDSSLFPDGDYHVRVVASDMGSHSPEDALSGERVSAQFSVDSTPPRIDALQAAFEDGALHITFRAADSFSPIKRAEYSVDAGEWQLVDPVGEISDARTESYDFFALTNPPAIAEQEEAPVANTTSKRRRKRQRDQPDTTTEEHLVAVRVYDRFDNLAAAKVIVSGTATTKP